MTEEEIKKAADTAVDDIINDLSLDINYEEDNYDAGEAAAIRNNGAQLFIDGANWSLSHQWVSVKDRLPKEDFDDDCQMVFVKKKIDKNTFIYSTDYIQDGKWAINRSGIVAWMPIPKSWEGKNDSRN